MGKRLTLTRRMDRKGGKITHHLEDGGQLLGVLTEYKYRASVERLGKGIRQVVLNTNLDLLRYFELLLVSFLTGNGDMHLKKFSILYQSSGEKTLAPTHDLVATRLLISEKEDPEEMALTVNGKRNKLSESDFLEAAMKMGLTKKQAENAIHRILRKMSTAKVLLQRSFLSDVKKDAFLKLLESRASRLVTKNLL